jgi:hypothetical protein
MLVNTLVKTLVKLVVKVKALLASRNVWLVPLVAMF